MFLFLVSLILCFANDQIDHKNVLKITFDQKQIRFSESELLKRNDIKTIKLLKDPSLNDQPNVYLAIEIKNLLKDFQLPKEASVYFKASDGMTVAIAQERLSGVKAKAYLALKPKNGNWHQLKSGQSVGPYFLIWQSSDLSLVGPEEWPYSVVEIEIKESVELAFPSLLPPRDHKNFKDLNAGYNLFVKNCLACHKLGQKGVSDFGPDLNYPMSPVDYFKPSALKKYIRNPRSVRTWAGSRMPGFDEKEISNQEMEQLITYLKYMSKK